jgi:hypothetical protein
MISGLDLRYWSQNSNIGSDFKAHPVLATYDIRNVQDVIADIRADIGDNIRIY